MIDIRQMRYFVAVAETLHFGRAAERLHLSQPPLSRQIAALEKDLGARLLERNSRRVALTAAGRRLLQDARATLAAFDQACRNARLAERGEVGELSLAFMMHAAYGVLPAPTRRLLASRPQVRLELREIVPGAIPDAVLSRRFDVGLTFGPGPLRRLDAAGVAFRPLGQAPVLEHVLLWREEAVNPALPQFLEQAALRAAEGG